MILFIHFQFLNIIKYLKSRRRKNELKLYIRGIKFFPLNIKTIPQIYFLICIFVEQLNINISTFKFILVSKNIDRPHI